MNDNELLKWIEYGLKTKLEETYETQIKPKMLEILDQRKDEIIAGIAVQIMREVRISEHGNILRIEVDTKNVKE